MLQPFLAGVLLPALLAGGCWAVAGWRRRRPGPASAQGQRAGPLALAGAFVAGNLALWGWPGLPPLLAEGWLPWLALGGLGAGLLAGLNFSAGWAVRSLLGLALAAATLWMTLGPKRATWTTGEAVAWQAALGAGLLLLLFGLERLAQRRPGVDGPLQACLWLAGLAGALALTGSLKYGQLGGLLAAVLGAATFSAWIFPDTSFGRGTLFVLVPLAAGLLLCGYFYSELPGPAALILFAAPLAPWLCETRWFSQRGPRTLVFFRAAWVAVAVAAALLLSSWPLLFPKSAPDGGAPEFEYRY